MTLDAAVRARAGDLELDVSLAARPGEILVLLGPNGAGKTTLLRALAGLVPLVDGRVALHDTVLEDVGVGVRLSPSERPVGFVFQDYLLFPTMSALDNVAFGLRARGMRRPAANAKAAEWLERMRLGPVANARPRDLSGGQAQRVALARALVTEPQLLLLDEPLAAIDAGARAELRRDLRRSLAGFEGVRLVVTHDPLEAMVLADRIVVLDEGRVVQEGSPDELRQHPRVPYVADLVGVNLLRGTARGDHIDVESGGELVAPGAGSGEVFAAIHPRAVALFRERPEGTPRNVWQARLERIDVEGDRVRLLTAGTVPLVAEITNAAATELGLREGDDVWVAVKATEIAAYPA